MGWSATLALAGDTMLGRGVAGQLASVRPDSLIDEEVARLGREADLFLLNLECCISDRGERWPNPRKAFFFRAPPVATEVLAHLGVDCVTLANNHALDYGREALLDTLAHLDSAGIARVGAGRNREEAGTPVILEAAGARIAILGFSDHPAGFAAEEDLPGIAYADLRADVPDWVVEAIGAAEADAVIVSPHWGPNMVTEPVPEVGRAAQRLLDAGATLVAGHSAHVFHGVAPGVIYDLGDLIDDYARDQELRNDLGILALVTIEDGTIVRIEAIPLALGYAHTAIARGEDAEWVRRRLERACAPFGTRVWPEEDRLVIAAD